MHILSMTVNAASICPDKNNIFSNRNKNVSFNMVSYAYIIELLLLLCILECFCM